MQRVMEDSMNTHDGRQWEGLEEMMALSAAGDVAIPELEMMAKEEVMEEPPVATFHPGLVGQGWGWSCTALEMAAGLGVNRSGRRRRGRRWCRHLWSSSSPPSTTHRRPICGRRRPTSTSSATTTTPAASEDGDVHDTDGRCKSARDAFFCFVFMLIMKLCLLSGRGNWAVLWPWTPPN